MYGIFDKNVRRLYTRPYVQVSTPVAKKNARTCKCAHPYHASAHAPYYTCTYTCTILRTYITFNLMQLCASDYQSIVKIVLLIFADFFLLARKRKYYAIARAPLYQIRSCIQQEQDQRRSTYLFCLPAERFLT